MHEAYVERSSAQGLQQQEHRFLSIVQDLAVWESSFKRIDHNRIFDFSSIRNITQVPYKLRVGEQGDIVYRFKASCFHVDLNHSFGIASDIRID